MSSNTIARLGELMTQIGEIEDFGLVAAHGDLPMWQVIIAEDDAPIVIEVDAQRQIAIFSSEIGTPAAERVDDVNRTALDYAHLYMSTGGARVTRSETDGIYSLVCEHALDTLERQNLGGELRRFAIMSKGWMMIVAGTRAEDPDPPALDDLVVFRG